jgi:hypothetical protein
LHVVFLAGIPACVIAFILAWRVPEYPLRSSHSAPADGDTLADSDGALDAIPVPVH